MSESTSTTAVPAAAGGSRLNRRSFVRSSVIAGTAVTPLFSKRALAQAPSGQLNVAICGLGAQGDALLAASADLAKAGTIRYTAVVDPWDYKRNASQKRLAALYRNEVQAFKTIDELLGSNAPIDCVLIACPDWQHHELTIKALKAGKHVYCEKMMSNSIESAKAMVLAQKETGKLCQIGHQRRSNPRYLALRNKIIGEAKLLGPLTHAYAQWNRAIQNPMVTGWPKGSELDAATLQALGYESMEQYCNWRWYKKFGGGPISDLGAHQIDLFNWFYGATPHSIQAVGSNQFYDGKGGRPKFEHNDNVTIMYEYKLPDGRMAFATYQVLTTSSSQGIFEKFIGTDASAVISEDLKNNQLYKENNATWDGSQYGELIRPLAGSIHHKFWEQPKPWWSADKWLYKEGVVDVRESKAAAGYELATILNKRPHTPHLENFFRIVSSGGKQEDLPCPVYDAYKTCVTVLKADQAVAEGRKIMFEPSDFAV